jgi:arsenical pump membrane protein
MARPRRIPDWAVATVAAALLVTLGVLSADGARAALSDLGPTVGFLAALLVLADGCRRAGLFDARAAGQRPVVPALRRSDDAPVARGARR